MSTLPAKLQIENSEAIFIDENAGFLSLDGFVDVVTAAFGSIVFSNASFSVSNGKSVSGGYSTPSGTAAWSLPLGSAGSLLQASGTGGSFSSPTAI